MPVPGARASASRAHLVGMDDLVRDSTSSIPASAITCASHDGRARDADRARLDLEREQLGRLVHLDVRAKLGRQLAERSAMIAMFRFATSRSSSSAGVVTSSRGRPICPA